MMSFMALNIINFADVAKREKDGVSWDVRRVSSGQSQWEVSSHIAKSATSA